MEEDSATITLADGVQIEYLMSEIREAVDAAWEDDEELIVYEDAEAAKRKLAALNVQVTLDQLNRSAKSGDLETVRLLLAAGVRDKPNKKAFWRSSLTYSAQFGKLDVLRELMASGSDYYAGSARGHSPLMFSCMRGEMPIIIYLVSIGIDYNASDSDGFTPFLLSVQHGHLEPAAFFVGLGTDIKHQAKDGTTALRIVNQDCRSPALKRYIKQLFKEQRTKKK